MNKAVKLKEPAVVRTYDKDGFRKRASCICVNEDESKILLVTSRKDNSQWIVPGGGVDPDEAEACAAVREVREEAGVTGKLGRCLGVFENAERKHRTCVFVMLVTEELDEWDESKIFGRQRQWFSIEAAVSVLHKPLQSNYVKLLLPPGHPYHAQPPHPHVAPIHTHPLSDDRTLSDSPLTVQPSSTDDSDKITRCKLDDIEDLTQPNSSIENKILGSSNDEEGVVRLSSSSPQNSDSCRPGKDRSISSIENSSPSPNIPSELNSI